MLNLVFVVKDDHILERFGIDPKQIEGYDILCLPENLEEAESVEQLYDTVESIDLCKLLKSQGLNCANSLDLGINIRYRDRRAADLWLGTLWILQAAVLSIVYSVIGAAVYAWVERKLGQKQEAPSNEINQTIQINQTIHINLSIPDGDIRREIKLDEQVDRFLKKLADVASEKESEQKTKESKRT